MALPTLGAISFEDIRNEFGGVQPTLINQFYAGGAHVPAYSVGASAIPVSGKIALGDFRGKTFPSLSRNTSWAFDTTVLLGTTISNPASDGAGTVVFRTSSGSQHFTYRSTDFGRSFHRVDPAQTLSGVAGTLLYVNGFWVYLIGSTYYYSTTLVSWATGSLPALPSSSSVQRLNYYWDHTGTASAYKSVINTHSVSVSATTPKAVGLNIIRSYTVVTSDSSYTQTYYNGTSIIIPAVSSTVQYTNIVSFDTGAPVITTSTSGAGQLSQARVGSYYLSTSGSSIQASYDLAAWTTVAQLDILGVPFAPDSTHDGSFYYSPELGYFYIIKKYVTYSGTAWVSSGGMSVWTSADGLNWSNSANLGTLEIFGGSNIPASYLIVFTPDLLVTIPAPQNIIPLPVATMKSTNGASWSAIPTVPWPTTGTWGGACWSGDSIVATSINFRAIIFS